eukprot:765309-Hanusia_phi.AAC.7
MQLYYPTFQLSPQFYPPAGCPVGLGPAPPPCGTVPGAARPGLLLSVGGPGHSAAVPGVECHGSRGSFC